VTALFFPGTAAGMPIFLAVLAVALIIDLAWPVTLVVVIRRVFRTRGPGPLRLLLVIGGLGLLLALAAVIWGLENTASGTGWAVLLLAPPALTWIAVPVWASILTLRHMRHGLWRRAAVAALLPVVAVLAVLHGRYLGDFIRFRLERSEYLTAIASVRDGREPPLDARIDLGPPTFAYFSWGGMLFASSGVAYDETDEAGRSPEEWSAAWRARQGQSELSCDAEIRPLGGHFYMVHAGC
jgi:hypothetical protein